MDSSHIGIAVALQRYQDFTPIALKLRELGQLIAAANAGTISVLSVNGPVETLPRVESTPEKLKRYVAPLIEAGFEAQVFFREGQPSHEIEAFVEEEEIDLLIIGSHSKRGPLDIGLGSTASSLKRELQATVLMIRPTVADQETATELMIPRYPFIFPYA